MKLPSFITERGMHVYVSNISTLFDFVPLRDWKRKGRNKYPWKMTLVCLWNTDLGVDLFLELPALDILKWCKPLNDMEFDT